MRFLSTLLVARKVVLFKGPFYHEFPSQDVFTEVVIHLLQFRNPVLFLFPAMICSGTKSPGLSTPFMLA